MDLFLNHLEWIPHRCSDSRAYRLSTLLNMEFIFTSLGEVQPQTKIYMYIHTFFFFRHKAQYWFNSWPIVITFVIQFLFESWGLNGIKTNPKHNITIWSLGVRFVAEILQLVQGTHCRIKDLNVEAWLFGGALLRDNPDKNACHCRGVASTPWSLHYSKKTPAVDANRLYRIVPKHCNWRLKDLLGVPVNTRSSCGRGEKKIKNPAVVSHQEKQECAYSARS